MIHRYVEKPLYLDVYKRQAGASAHPSAGTAPAARPKLSARQAK